MLAYRDAVAHVDGAALLGELRSAVGRLAETNAPSLDDVRRALIDAGTLECAAADAASRDTGQVTPPLAHLRAAAVALGAALHRRWAGLACVRDAAMEARGYLDAVAGLSGRLSLRTPEGYAHYAVYPESYVEAARRCAESLSPATALCVGLRTIGSSLAAAVAGTFADLGIPSALITLRPTGHPFDRTMTPGPDVLALLRAAPPGIVCVVDEGPGQSGSSIAAAAEMLVELGVDRSRIVLMPSYAPDVNLLSSGRARQTWRRHRIFAATFERVWRRSGTLLAGVPAEPERELSGGAWRGTLGPRRARAHHRHERRKFLTADEPPRRRVLEFIGLGRYADARLERAGALAEVGLAPAIAWHGGGFLLREVVEGTPMRERSALDEAGLEHVARYLAAVSRRTVTEPGTSAEALEAMVRINVGEAGVTLRDPLSDRPCTQERVVALDNRLFSVEWVRDGGALRKVDSLTHADDHFYPGPNDIAWDVAGAEIELCHTREARHRLRERYRALAGDHTIDRRLPFYRVAYLAARIGYATAAAAELGSTPDGARFARAAARYRRRLRAELGAAP